jgi:hypothetical protein
MPSTYGKRYLSAASCFEKARRFVASLPCLSEPNYCSTSLTEFGDFIAKLSSSFEPRFVPRII